MSRRAWVTLLTLSSLCAAACTQEGRPAEHQIRVRLLKPSGRPLAYQIVRVGFRIAKQAELQEVEVITGTEGLAKVPLPTIPPTIYFQPKSENLYPCSDLLPFETGKIITTGVIASCSKHTPGCRCKFSKRALGVNRSPGEVVLFFRGPNLLERVFRNLWE